MACRCRRRLEPCTGAHLDRFPSRLTKRVHEFTAEGPLKLKKKSFSTIPLKVTNRSRLRRSNKIFNCTLVRTFRDSEWAQLKRPLRARPSYSDDETLLRTGARRSCSNSCGIEKIEGEKQLYTGKTLNGARLPPSNTYVSEKFEVKEQFYTPSRGPEWSNEIIFHRVCHISNRIEKNDAKKQFDTSHFPFFFSSHTNACIRAGKTSYFAPSDLW